MIKILFSSNTDENFSPEIELSGNKEDFANLTLRLKQFLKSEKQEVKIEADSKANSYPYEETLESLVVLKDNNPVLVSVTDKKELQVEGTIECLDAFVSNIEFVEEGSHLHYEYYDGNEWISPDSLPLVIASEKEDFSL